MTLLTRRGSVVRQWQDYHFREGRVQPTTGQLSIWMSYFDNYWPNATDKINKKMIT